MLEQKDLELLGQLMDQKLQAQKDDIVQTMDQKLQAQKDDIFQAMDQKLQAQKKDIIQDVNAILEVRVLPKIQLIAEQHGEIIDRLPRAEEQELLRSRVQVLENVVIQLRHEMDQLKKAQ